MSQDPLQTYLEQIGDESFENCYNSLIQEIRERGKKDLLFLAKYILGYKELEETVHRPMCSFYQRPEKKKLILAPRGSFKTSLLTVAGTIQNILNDPNIRILLDNAVLGNSMAWLREIRGHFERNEKFRQVYGDWVGTGIWTDKRIIVPQRTIERASPTITCIGVETGTGGTSQHYDRINGDDLVTLENTSTLDQIEKLKDHYRNLLPILDPGGYLDLIGTRWEFEDLYGDIQRDVEKGTSPFILFVEKAIRDDNTLFFPKRLTREFLAEQLSSTGMGSHRFSAQYQNEPVDSETAPFKRKAAELTYYDLDKLINEAQTNIRPLRILITCDPAISESQTADYTVVNVLAVDHESTLYELDYTREHWGNPKFIIDEIYRQYERWQYITKEPIRIGIESVAYQKALIYGFKDHPKFNKTKGRLFIHQLTSDTNKTRRILSLQPRYENHAFRWLPVHTELESELYRFPKSQHDDILDTVAMALQMLAETDPPKKVDPSTIRGTMAWWKKQNQRPKPGERHYGSSKVLSL